MTWREDKHPRDRLGHFINVGAHVRLSGGAEGSVIRTLAGARVEVRRDDNGKHVAVGVGNITVLSEADGSKPAKPNTPTAATGKPSAQPAGTPDLSTPEGLHAHLQTHPGGDKVPAFTAEHLAAYTNMHDRAHALGVDTHSHDAAAAPAPAPAPAVAPRKPRAPRKPKVMPDNEGAQKVDAALALLDNVRGPEADAMDEAGRNYADAIDTNAKSPDAAEAGAAFAAALDTLAATLNPETDRLNLETVQAAHDAIRPEHRPKRESAANPDQLALAGTGPRRARTRKAPPPAVTGPASEGPFTSVEDANAALARIPVEGRPDGEGTLADPIDVGDDLDAAVKHLAEGKHVRVNQKADVVSSLLHEITKFNTEARASNGQGATLDLCKVSVGHRNLFCAGNKGIPRAQMPQLGGAVVPGSLAESMQNRPGFADITDHFRAALAARGIKTTLKDVHAGNLRATQNELDGPKVAAMTTRMQEGTLPKTPIFVTRDGYIIDGHHRWAATSAVGLSGGDGRMPVEEVDLDIGAAIDFANAFATGMGIQQVSIGEKTTDVETQRLAASKRLTTRFKMTESRPDGSAWGSGYPVADPRTDAEYDAYTAYITSEIDKGMARVTRNGEQLGTHSLFTIEGEVGVYTPARTGLHEAILATYMARFADVPKDRQAIFMAGPMGSGKSTVIKRRGAEFGVESYVDAAGEVQPTNFAVVNPDIIKDDLVRAGLPQEYADLDLQPAEAATIVHEESTDIAKELQRRLIAAGYNFIADSSFNGNPDKAKAKVDKVREAGYHVRGVLVDGNLERSYINAADRHRGKRTGPPYEGRFVPFGVVDSGKAPVGAISPLFGRPYRSAPALNFEHSRAAFDKGALWYDNTTGDTLLTHQVVGGQQVTVDSGGGVTIDGAAGGQKTLVLFTRAARR